MRLLRDEQLFEMAYSRPEDGIVPEAVEAARSELAARNIRAPETRALEEQVLEAHEEDAGRATRHLPGLGVAVFMIFGLTLVGTFGIFALFTMGRKQMAIDALYATFVGIVVGWALLLLGMLLLG